MSLIWALFSSSNQNNDSSTLANHHLLQQPTNESSATGGGGMADATAALAVGSTMHQLPGFTDMIAVLFECLSIITLGYLSCRFKLISPEAKDLGAYLSTFALPMIIFLNIAQMEFQTINLSFLFVMLMAKLSLFIIVTIFTLAISYPRNFSYAGALSILATQSNDFALGYPLVKSLYGETRPEMLSYLSLMAPIQLLILNPLGIVMLEFEKSRQRSKRPRHDESPAAAATDGDRRRERHFCRRRLVHSGERDSRRQRHDASGAAQNKPPQQLARPRASSDAGYHHPEAPERCCDTAAATALAIRDNKPPKRSSLIRANGQVIGCLHPSIVGKKSINSLVHSTWPPGNQHSQQQTFSYDIVQHECSLLNANKLSGPPSTRRSSLRSIAPAACDSLNHSSSVSEESIDALDCRLVGCTNSSIVYSASQSTGTSGATAVAPTATCRTQPKLFSGLRAIRRRSLSRGNATTSDVATSSEDDLYRKCDCGQFGASNSNSQQQNHRQSTIDFAFLKALITNPLIIASVVALAVNLTHGPELPKFVTKVSNTIAASFAAPALLVVGLSMYGKFELLSRNPSDLLLATILVISKVLILPSLMRTISLIILPHYTTSEEIAYLTDFSYLYGLLPTAPGACIIAQQYGVLSNVVSISMLLSTFISAPLLLVAAYIINKSLETLDNISMLNLFTQTLRASSVLTLTLSLVTIYVLLKVDKPAILDYIKRGKSRLITSIVSTSNSSSTTTTATATTTGVMAASARARQIQLFTSELFHRQMDSLRACQLFTLMLTCAQLVIGLGGCMWLLMDGYLTPREDETTGSPHTWADHTNTWSMIMCSTHYIFASGGILMARFVILSMVVTSFAFKFRDHQVATRVMALMLRMFALFGVCLLVCLVFESSHSSCKPTEASLPSWPVSLQLRLLYNTIILVVAVPLLAQIFRADNKANYLHQQRHQNVNSERLCSDSDGHSMKSSPSLSSTSTANTNIDFTTRATTTTTSSHDVQQGSVLLDCAALDSLIDGSARVQASETTSQQHQATRGTSHTNPNYRDDFSDLVSEKNDSNRAERKTMHQQAQQNDDLCCRVDVSSRRFSNYVIIDTNDSGDYVSSLTRDYRHHDGNQLVSPQQMSVHHATDNNRHHQHQKPSPPIRETKSNRHSILIVFMLIQVVLNMTSIIQVLIQDKPTGTFIQAEATTVAIDFGQGLLTFLVIGTQRSPI